MIEPHIYGEIDGLNCDQWIFMMIFFFVLFLFCTVLLFTSLCADISLSKDSRDHVKTHWTLVYGLILFDHCSNWGDEEGKPHGALFLSFTRDTYWISRVCKTVRDSIKWKWDSRARFLQTWHQLCVLSLSFDSVLAFFQLKRDSFFCAFRKKREI